MAKAELQKTTDYQQQTFVQLVPITKDSGVVLSLTMDEAYAIRAYLGTVTTAEFNERIENYQCDGVPRFPRGVTASKSVDAPFNAYRALNDALGHENR